MRSMRRVFGLSPRARRDIGAAASTRALAPTPHDDRGNASDEIILQAVRRRPHFVVRVFTTVQRPHSSSAYLLIMTYCSYCDECAVSQIPAHPAQVCLQHAVEFWTGLLT